MSRYAEKTAVPVDKSKAEIECVLARYGATSFASGWDGNRAMIQFEARGRRIRFILPLPNKTEKRFTHTPGRGLPRKPDESMREWEQACRQSWRALALVVKAKLEAVAAGITEFEDEFLANIVMPDGLTVADHVKPKIEIAYQQGDMPPMLPNYGPRQ